jgi:serine/threonine protein kinase
MRDKIKKTLVCIKIIKIKNIANKEREAAKAEVELLRRLHHPNIVRYIDSFLSKNHESLCIVMEYCDGGDLASQIKSSFTKRKLFSEDKILHWFVQIALGVHYMHTMNVLHRDLKTQNVFLLGNGRLVLGDLGISKVLEGTMDFAQTCIGTPYYMSPEIFKNKPYSYKSDVWALGCILYEMTTLNHAFDSTSLNGLAQKIIKGKYPPIDSRYSRYLRELIAHMLLPEPKQRPNLDQILRKPFIKKHILSFFHEIISRPTESIGEGTMIFKAAAAGGVGHVAAAAGGGGGGSSLYGNDRLSHLGNDINMLSLRDQLESLDMTQAILESMVPITKRIPQDEIEAKRLAKEQANALKREKDHRVMVEQALAKLRHERELRANQGRNRPTIPKRSHLSDQSGGNGGAGTGLKKEAAPNKPAAMRQPRQGGMRIYEQQNSGVTAAAAPSPVVGSHHAAAGRGGAHSNHQQSNNPLHPPPSMQHPYNLMGHPHHQPSSQNQSQSHHSNHGNRGKRHSEARDRMEAEERERERRLKEITEEEMAAKKRREEILFKLGRDSKKDVAVKEQERLKSLVSQHSSLQINDGPPPGPSERKNPLHDQGGESKLSPEKPLHGGNHGRRRERDDDMSSSPSAGGKQSHASAPVSGINESSPRYGNGRGYGHGGGKGTRHDQRKSRNSFESEGSPNEGEVTRKYGASSSAVTERTQPSSLNRTSSLQKRRSDSDDDDDDSIEEEEEIPWQRRGRGRGVGVGVGVGNEAEGGRDREEEEVEEEEEVINEVLHRREEELQAELMLATKRCQELKQTLQVTKSFIESKASQGSMYPLGGSMQQLKAGEVIKKNGSAEDGGGIIEESDDDEGSEGDDSDELEEVIEYEDDDDNEIGVSPSPPLSLPPPLTLLPLGSELLG